MDNLPDLSGGFELPSGIPDVGDGIAGIILGILAWIIFSILLLLFIWFFGAIVCTMVLAFAAMLYWIFFRAVRLVFNIKGHFCGMREGQKFLHAPTDIEGHVGLFQHRAVASDSRRLDAAAPEIDAEGVVHENCPSDTHHPPSTASTWPVTNLDSSLMKNTAAESVS